MCLSLSKGSKTHITTDLNAEGLENKYGNRIISRLRAMFNLISIDKTSKDKRLKKSQSKNRFYPIISLKLVPNSVSNTVKYS